MNYENIDKMLRKLSVLDKTEATKRLTEYCAKAKFNLSQSDFPLQFTDGSNDGGIDFYHIQGNNFYIFQSKFSGKPKKTTEDEIMHEVNKIIKTLSIENPNKRAEGFVNSLRRALSEEDAFLEIFWLTTNITEQSVREAIRNHLNIIRHEKKWKINAEFVVIDKNDLEGIIFDFNHGFVPQAGKRSVRLEDKKWIREIDYETGVLSIVCTVNVNDILQWFTNLQEIDNFLQKNVRGFLGEKGINKGIQKSYRDSAEWFWFKHNGIIIFADTLEIGEHNGKLEMRNPQIVNGGQTLKVLYSAYDKLGKQENTAKVLLRAYRLPYYHSKTYRISIDIIEALNSQNRILPSDLRSNDPRQVRLERLLKDRDYLYFRKRAKGIKSGNFSIPMWKLAPLYYCCKKHAPHATVAMHVQELFREEPRYNNIFNEIQINRQISAQHIVLKYITVWKLSQVLQNRRNDLPERDKQYFQYTKFFVLADLYEKLMKWKTKKFKLSWKSWIDFVESAEFEKEVWTYARFAFRISSRIIPRNGESRRFFRSRKSTEKFDRQTSRTKFEGCTNRAFLKFRNRVT